ncbi:hypothetical protein [Gordonia oryzae]|uniref:hypothetical protein n=1 Tax=Gordonia oryzae TaxID=2487349 RepID=UPI00161A9FBE|nr:hypothetical protein [Gordonia oryzae]
MSRRGGQIAAPYNTGSSPIAVSGRTDGPLQVALRCTTPGQVASADTGGARYASAGPPASVMVYRPVVSVIVARRSELIEGVSEVAGEFVAPDSSPARMS